jgi:hypothetical protein
MGAEIGGLHHMDVNFFLTHEASVKPITMHPNRCKRGISRCTWCYSKCTFFKTQEGDAASCKKNSLADTTTQHDVCLQPDVHDNTLSNNPLQHNPSSWLHIHIYERVNLHLKLTSQIWHEINTTMSQLVPFHPQECAECLSSKTWRGGTGIPHKDSLSLHMPITGRFGGRWHLNQISAPIQYSDLSTLLGLVSQEGINNYQQCYKARMSCIPGSSLVRSRVIVITRWVARWAESLSRTYSEKPEQNIQWNYQYPMLMDEEGTLGWSTRKVAWQRHKRVAPDIEIFQDMTHNCQPSLVDAATLARMLPWVWQGYWLALWCQIMYKEHQKYHLQMLASPRSPTWHPTRQQRNIATKSIACSCSIQDIRASGFHHAWSQQYVWQTTMPAKDDFPLSYVETSYERKVSLWVPLRIHCKRHSMHNHRIAGEARWDPTFQMPSQNAGSKAWDHRPVARS